MFEEDSEWLERIRERCGQSAFVARVFAGDGGASSVVLASWVSAPSLLVSAAVATFAWASAAAVAESGVRRMLVGASRPRARVGVCAPRQIVDFRERGEARGGAWRFNRV